jgi:hypothetical protein
MKKCFLFTSMLFIVCLAFSQSASQMQDSGYKADEVGHQTAVEFPDTASISAEKLRWLKEEYGRNKAYPEEYEKLVLAALSFFPELKEYRVSFIVRNHGAPLSSRPSYGTMIRHASKRKYLVFISSDTSNKWKEIQLNRVPQIAQIGIIGHEISHILEFRQKTSVGLIVLGMNHASASYMNKFEFQADSIGISHGMGEYFLAWAIHAREAFGSPDPQQLQVKGEKSNYKERYMSPATIRRYMQEIDNVQ